MPLRIWIDGKFCDKQDAKIGVYDHGLLYGDGVFEGIRVYQGKIFECESHLRRLWDSAKAIRLTIPRTMEITSAMEETVRLNGFTECYIRLVVTRGAGYLGLNPDKCSHPSVIIIADGIELYAPELYEKGISIITASVTRSHPNSLSPRIKSLNYLNNILARIEAVDAGVHEALMLNYEGNVAECTGDNIFIVQNSVVMTPGTADGILEGITRSVIMQLCRSLSIPCFDKTLQRHDLYKADECFLTGTAAEVIPVTRIDARPVANSRPGPITRKLMEAFKRHTKG